jgi:glycosyltransferase involved in cell wall biosynthesis
MRIALIGPAHPYKGGAAQHTTALAHHLAGAGHDVVLESWIAQYPRILYPGQPTIDRPESPLFEPTHRHLSWRRPDGWFRHGRRIGRGSDLVILMYHSPVQVPSYLVILKALEGTCTRSVAIANNVTSHESRVADRTLTGALLRRVDGVLVHGPDQAAEARALTNQRVEQARLPPHLPTPSAAQPPTVGPEGRVHNALLFFGLVRPYKGLDVLLRALAVARARPSLLVAGEFWQSEAAIQELITDLQLSSRVTLRPGYVDTEDIPSLFGAADALVLPYRNATGSQNAQLAFRYGIPVIATKTGSLSDSVRDGVDGIVCKPDDVVDLARAIDRLYEPGEAARLRSGIRFEDGSKEWNTYIETLVSVAPERSLKW